LRYLVDTNVLLRCIAPRSSQYRAATGAIRRLRRRRHRLCILPQTILELWAVCTRPAPPTANGLGLPQPIAKRYAAFAESFFELLPEHPGIYRRWRALVSSYAVVGRQVYDARLVASMLVHSVGSVITFNVSDFRRFPEIEVVHPEDV